MVHLAPPRPPIRIPRVALADDDGLRRMRARSLQLSLSIATILATAWCCSLGWGPGIIALMVAKHVLVAILAMGLGIDAPKRAELG
ncbi:MAG: hypothetical protein ACK4RK_08140 [Gemmataceae bacterium]